MDGRPDISGKRAGPYLLTSIIAVGSSGDVYRAVDTSSKDCETYAIKCLPKKKLSRKQCMQIASELFNHSMVTGCQYVLPLCDIVEKKSYVFIVFALCETDMSKAIWETRLYWRNDPLIKTAFIEVLDGLYACHQKGVSHRDLQPENLMCNENGTGIRIGDFGLATNQRVCSDGGCGSPFYMSPECWTCEEEDSYFGDLSDIWSLGIILFNMVTSCYPWKAALPSNEEYRAYIRDQDYFCDAYQISESLNELLRRMLHPVPMKRFTIPRIRKEIIEMNTFYQWDCYDDPQQPVAPESDQMGVNLAKEKKQRTFAPSSVKKLISWRKFHHKSTGP